MSERSVTAYHYTDQKGKEAIKRTGVIEPSQNGRYGPGVYLTTMSPSVGRKAVSQNNWDGAWKGVERQGRADYAFKVELPASSLHETPGNRDILIHTGPIRLSDHKHQAMQK